MRFKPDFKRLAWLRALDSRLADVEVNIESGAENPFSPFHSVIPAKAGIQKPTKIDIRNQARIESKASLLP